MYCSYYLKYAKWLWVKYDKLAAFFVGVRSSDWFKDRCVVATNAMVTAKRNNTDGTRHEHGHALPEACL